MDKLDNTSQMWLIFSVMLIIIFVIGVKYGQYLDEKEVITECNSFYLDNYPECFGLTDRPMYDMIDYKLNGSDLDG